MKAENRILITGLSGFVGQNLKEHLKNSYEIVNLSLRDKTSFDKVTNGSYKAIIHLAGKAHDLKNISDPSEYYEVNTELTKRLFTLFLESNIEVFITLSSVKAAADKVHGILTEETITNPETHYGKSKLLAEQYIFSQQIPSNKRVYVLRPCMIHGPKNKGNLNLLFKIVNSGIPYPLGSFNNRRSFLSIVNLNFIIEELIKRNNIPTGIYNAADDASISTNQLIDIINKVLNQKTKIVNISPQIINFIAKIGSFLHLPFNQERLEKLTESYVVSNKKLLMVLDKKLPLSTEAGLSYTIKSFINE